MTDYSGGPRTLSDVFGTLFSNPAVIEGVIAGISALSASRRTKNSLSGTSDGAAGNPASGNESSLLDALPGLLPLLSMLMQSGGGAPDVPAPVSAQTGLGIDIGSHDQKGDEGEDGGLSALLSGIGESENEDAGQGEKPFADRGVSISYGSRESQRENLLLAIMPFLSESRRSAAEAMVQVNKLSGLFRRG